MEEDTLAELEIVGVTARRLYAFMVDERDKRNEFPNMGAVPETLRNPIPVDEYAPATRLIARGYIKGSRLVPSHVKEEVKSYNDERVALEKLEQLLNLDSGLWFHVHSYKRWEHVR